MTAGGTLSVVEVVFSRLASGDAGLRGVELRDGAGKLQGKWDSGTRVLEMRRRAAKTWYWLEACT